MPNPDRANQPPRPHEMQEITAEMLAADRIDQNTRRNNIKIAGLVESMRECTFITVMTLFRDMELDVRDNDILKCYRLGKKLTTKPGQYLLYLQLVL